MIHQGNTCLWKGIATNDRNPRMSPWVNLGFYLFSIFFLEIPGATGSIENYMILSCFSEQIRIFFKLGKHYPVANCKSEDNYNRQLYWMVSFLWNCTVKWLYIFFPFCILDMPTSLITLAPSTAYLPLPLPFIWPKHPLQTHPYVLLSRLFVLIGPTCARSVVSYSWQPWGLGLPGSSDLISAHLQRPDLQSVNLPCLWFLDLVFGLGLHGVWILMCSVDEVALWG